MTKKPTKDLNDYLSIKYPYSVTEDDGEFFIQYPDLPGCMTQVEHADDIHPLALEIKGLWLTTVWETGDQIPEGPAQDFSGKFVVRVPKSLHRDLTYQARDEGMSLNSLVLHLLSERSSLARLEALMKSPISVPTTTGRRDRRETSYSIPDSSKMVSWSKSGMGTGKSARRGRGNQRTTTYILAHSVWNKTELDEYPKSAASRN